MMSFAFDLSKNYSR